MMTTKQIFKELDAQTTTNPYEAIYIFKDGTMMGGEYDCGIRGLDHNQLISFFNEDLQKMHYEYKIVRLVPETQIYLMGIGQRLTPLQKEIVDYLGYERENYIQRKDR